MPASAPKLPSLPEGPAFDRVRGPIEIPAYEPWQIALAFAVGILFLGLLIWLFLRARRKAAQPTPPYDAAIAELEAATHLTNDDDERFAILSSQALRRYLEDGLGLRFSARTSEEFLRNLKGNTKFDQDFQSKLGDVLATFDQIKFAQESTSKETRIHITDTVRQLIDQAHTIAQQEGEPT
ncbi:hypothetical protein ACWPKS_17730 [Coraliomargarita sp. W4R72]